MSDDHELIDELNKECAENFLNNNIKDLEKFKKFYFLRSIIWF